MVDINKILPKPDVSVPRHLLQSPSQSDRNRLVNDYFCQILAWAQKKGFDIERDYLSEDRAKLLNENTEKEAEYKKRFDEAVAKINAKGKQQIMKLFRPVDVTDNPEVRLKWKKPVVYEFFDSYDNKHTVSATPEKLCERLFDGIYSMFDVNPLTEPQEFRKEAFEKLSDRTISEIAYNKNGDSHRFEIRLQWIV